MRFGEHLDRLPPERHDTALARLAMLAASGLRRSDGAPAPERNAVDNLWAEIRLAEDAWRDLTDALIACSHDPASCRAAVTAWGRRHPLDGPVCDTLPDETVYAHCVSVEHLVRWLREHSPFRERTADSVRAWLIGPAGSDAEGPPDGLHGIPLTEFHAWATLNRDDPYAGPLTGISPLTADGVRARLGLDERDRGRALLVLCYTLPVDSTGPGVRPHFPTAATGCASENWSPFFRTNTDPAARFGSTHPWPPLLADDGRPEVVHRPVTGDRLEGPVRMLDP